MQSLENFRRAHDALVCIDSDGCAFDVMEIKHKECFCPAYIEHFSLQPVSKYAREAWEFVNLYSAARGVHRLLALVRSLDLLDGRAEARQRGFRAPRLAGLRAFLASGAPLCNESLEAWLKAHPDDADTAAVLDWSLDVNARIARMVHGIPPFPHVREGLDLLSGRADIVIVSATQRAALEREWQEHDILRRVSLVCGQEQGSKAQIIAALSPQYAPGRCLMIGDAPGDRDAAHKNGALFYPVRPDEETESWAEFGPAAERFFAGCYAGETEAALVEAFNRLLPEKPCWKTAV